MTTIPTIAFAGQAQVASLLNVRQGQPDRKAPLARKLTPGTTVLISAVVVGEKVQGNPQWFRLDDGTFVWSGGCGTLRQGVQTDPTDSAGAPSRSAIAQAGLDGFGLESAFAKKLAELILECRAKGHNFRISQGIRTPQRQALYYCQWQGRPRTDIDACVEMLRKRRAPWLADMVAERRDVPLKPNWQTNAPPGAGWHQWGEAADCYCYRDGEQVGKGSDPAYAFYATTAERMGLTAGLRFSKPDAGHVQLRAASGATDIFGWDYIEAVMRERFAEKPGLD